MTNIEKAYQIITIVKFKAFAMTTLSYDSDKEIEEHFYDCTPEQCTEYIWKKIAPTAQILSVTEYKIEHAKKISGFKRFKNGK